jgi:DNA topoisomerase VI subunit B
MTGKDAALMSQPPRSPRKARGGDAAEPRQGKPRQGASRGATAEEMGSRQRDISVSEFFAKNRHLLGFDNPRKALLTTVKEAVDNSLDACEEGGILPELAVIIEDLQPDRPATAKSSRYRVTVVDNGPGIVRKQIENIFGRLLYGSKFHRLKMSRGQQGIGISAAGMYGLITTGRPMRIVTKVRSSDAAHRIELAMNTKTNRAEVTLDEETKDFPPTQLREVTAGARSLASGEAFLHPKVFATGTSVSIELEGRYQKGRGSVDEFLELTGIANPHARITYVPPTRESAEESDDLLPAAAASVEVVAGEAKVEVTSEHHGVIVFPRAVAELPPETREIQPHPKGVELGTLLQMLKEYEATEKGSLFKFLQEKFCRVSAATAGTLCEAAGATSRTRAGDIEAPQAERLYAAFQEAKLGPPPVDCLAPIGVRQLLAGMLKGVRAEFYAASSRQPDIYRGRPFQIEAAIAFGGELPADEPSRQPRAAALPAERVLQLQGRGRNELEKLRPHASARRHAGGTAGRADPHGERVGALHERVEGSDRRLRRDPQGDEVGAHGVRAQAGHLSAQASAHAARKRAARCLRALHWRSLQVAAPHPRRRRPQGLRRASDAGQAAHARSRPGSGRGRQGGEGRGSGRSGRRDRGRAGDVVSRRAACTAAAGGSRAATKALPPRDRRRTDPF